MSCLDIRRAHLLVVLAGDTDRSSQQWRAEVLTKLKESYAGVASVANVAIIQCTHTEDPQVNSQCELCVCVLHYCTLSSKSSVLPFNQWLMCSNDSSVPATPTTPGRPSAHPLLSWNQLMQSLEEVELGSVTPLK